MIVAALALVGALMAGLASAAVAEPKAGSVTVVEGTVTVKRPSGSRPTRLRVAHAVRDGDQIAVGPRSLVRLRVGGALITVLERSAVTLAVGDDPTGLTLEWGTVVYKILPGTSSSGAHHDVRSPNSVVRVHAGVIVLDVDLPATAPFTQTRLCMVDGTASARHRWLAGSVISVSPTECLAVSGAYLGQPRDGRYREINRARALAGLAALPEPPAGGAVVPRVAVRAAPRPGAWVLLIDHGSGFTDWIGSAADGYVAGDVSVASMSLAACDNLARGFAAHGQRLACARDPWRAMRDGLQRRTYHDAQGRVLARGPMAGRFVVYEPGSETDEWRLLPLSGSQPVVSVAFEKARLAWRLPIADCPASVERDRQTACARSSAEGGEFRDIAGRLMATGPFAGGLITMESR